jgi:ribosomal protein L13
MMPKNRLRRQLARKLRIFPGKDHLFNEQLPSDAEPIIFSSEKEIL